MTIVDKVIAAVTAPEPGPASASAATEAGAADRAAARERLRATAEPQSWLECVLDHHLEIDQAFAQVAAASGAAARLAAHKQLAGVLTGHSLAEEVVIYPAIAREVEPSQAMQLYAEQSQAKVEMAALELLDPSGAGYLDQLEKIRLAIVQHVHEEESDLFPALQSNAAAADQTLLAQRYNEEFRRYTGATSAERAALLTALPMKKGMAAASAAAAGASRPAPTAGRSA